MCLSCRLSLTGACCMLCCWIALMPCAPVVAWDCSSVASCTCGTMLSRYTLECKQTCGCSVMQGVTAQIKALATGGMAERQAHPYDIGIGSNLQAVFGDSLWHWCVPPVGTAAGGTSYPTRYDHKHDFW